MKLLYAAFDPVPWPKGSGTRIRATVEAYAEAGAEVHLHTPRPSKVIPGFPERLEGPGIVHRPVDVHHENFLERVLNFRESVAALLVTEQFDAAVFRSPWEGLPIVQKVARPVYEVHGFPSVELASHYPLLGERPHLLDRLIGEENCCLMRSRLFVTPSATSRHFLMRRGADPRRIVTVPNSIDLSEFPEPTAIPSLEGPFRIGYMGTLAPWQGLGTAVEALALLRRRFDSRLVLAGTLKKRWMRPLKELAKRLGVHRQLEFHGPLNKLELHRVLSSCHTLVAPLPDDPRNSLQGCCPIKILEYMSCGRPIVSTRIPPVEELLEDGVDALLCRPSSAASLAQTFSTLRQNPALGEALAARAFRRVRERYSRQRFREQIQQVWGEIQEMHQRPPGSERPELEGSML